MRKMKRCLSLLITVIMVFSIFCVVPMNVSAATYTVLLPVQGGRIAYSYGYSSSYFNGTQFHLGVDIHASSDKTIYAAETGTVSALVNSCPHTSQPDTCSCNSYGNYITIRHSDGTYSHYAHLKQNSMTVSKGQSVIKGQAIATMGSSGNSSGPHLHFELRQSDNSTRINVNPVSSGGSVNYSTSGYGGIDQYIPGTASLSVRAGSSVEYTQFYWNETANTDYCAIHIYDVSTGERIYFETDITYRNHQVKLDPGNYYAHITTCSNALKEYTDYYYRVSNDVYFTVEEAEFAPVNSIESEESRYELYDIALPWTEAKAKCEELGGHLVVINSQEEQALIEELWGSVRRSTYWLGLTDMETEGTWTTVTGEEIVYSNWDSGEPNDNQGEDFAIIYTGWLGWNDVANGYGSNTLGFICEYPKTFPEGLEYEITDGEVTITGYTGSVASLIIPSEIEDYPVTGIGKSAFYNCKSLKSIVIPNSVNNIGSFAFEGCSSLVSLTIPTSVTYVGTRILEGSAYYVNESNWHNDMLFVDSVLIMARNTTSGTNNNIPEGTTLIADNAFSGCENWTDIVIPSSVKNVCRSPFSNCNSLVSLRVDENNTVYDSRDNCNAIIETATNTLIQGCNTTIIPSSITSLGYGAFSACMSIQSITLPEGITEIGNIVFYHCDALESIVIPESVTYIGESAFEECSSLLSVSIPEGVTSLSCKLFNHCTSLLTMYIPSSVTTIDSYATFDCPALTDVHFEGTQAQWDSVYISYGNDISSATIHVAEDPIPEGLEYEIADGEVTITKYTGEATELEIPSTIQGYPVTTIGDAAFEYCQEIESISIPESVTYIGSRAFYNCAVLKNLFIPQNVTSIGAAAFSACGMLESIIVDENNTVYDSRDNCNAIIETSTNTLLLGCAYTDIPSTVTSIGEGAFNSCGLIEEITIPDGVTSIGKEAFMCCVALKNVTIADSVTSIGENAFVACLDLESISLPKNLTTVGGYAFSGCKALKDVYYSGTQAQWNAITIESGNEYLTNATIHCATQSYTVTFIDYDGNVLSTQTVDQGASAVEPEIPYRDGYEFTGWDTDFSNVQYDLVVSATYNYLTLISGDFEYTVSDGEVTITAYSGSATNLVVPEYINDYPVVKIGNDAFSYCQTLAGVELPSTLREIGENAFKYCKGLLGILIPEGVETIGKSAFYGCTALTGISIPSTVNRIGDEAFVFCEGLISVEISEGVEVIGSYAFRGCLELASIVIPNTVTNVEERAFYGCTALDDVYYGGTSAEWAENTIADYNDPLTAATIHYNSNDIPLGLEYSISNGAVTITGYTGSNAVLDVPETIEGYPVTTIGANAFDSLTNLVIIILPDSVTSISEGAFKYCKGIAGIDLPEGIKEISANAFYGCTALTEITIPDGVEKIGNQAFIYCEALKSVILPSSVTDIGDFAFRGCTVLENVETADGLKNIGASAFRGCSAIKEISLPKSVDSIGEKAFYACSKLADVYYGGSEIRWADVSVAEGNEPLTTATMHYALNSEDEVFTVIFVDYDGTVLDTQTIEYGSAASAPADPTRNGYKFKGWDTDFSNVTADLTVTAQYSVVVPKGTLKIEVTGGTGFTVSINGGNARPQGSVYRNSKLDIGATVTVVAKETANATFVGWMNPITGMILSSDYTYTFTATGNDHFNAVYTTQIEGVQVVTFKNDKANRILDSQYYAAEDTIQFPDAPTQVGYDFAGWSMTEAEIKSAIAAGEDVTVVANWTRAIVPVQVTVTGGQGTGTYNANSSVTVTADAPAEGEKFAYWTDAEGNIRSYNAQYKFYPSMDTELIAVFVAEDTVIDYQILVSLDSIDYESQASANKAVFTYSWYCPEEYTFVKAGVVAVNKDNYNEATFVAGSSDSNVYDRSPSGTNLKPVNTFTWTKSNVTSGQTWMAKAYVQYKDADGVLHTVYSDTVEATKE